MTDKPVTTTGLQEALNLANQINQKAEEALAPLMQAMERLKYPPEFRLMMWEIVARKASTYAERIK